MSCPLHWIASIPTRPPTGPGSSCFRLRGSVVIHNGVHPLAFICTSRRSSGRWRVPCVAPASRSASAALLPALIRDASARGRLRHSHGARVARAFRRQYDDDVLARPEPRRAWGSESVRPAVRVERCVSCKRPLPTVAESSMRSLVQLIHARAVAASGRLAVFQRSLQPAAANHVARGQPRRARTLSRERQAFISQPLRRERQGTSIPTSGREGAAANAGARCIRVAEYRIHIRALRRFPARLPLRR